MAEYQKKTPEQLEAEKTEMLDKIKNLGENFKNNPEDIAELVAFQSKFYQYSVNNQILIYMQNQNAAFVGSFMSFKDKGYSVNKGEKGLKIFVPVKVNLIKDNNEWVQFSKASKELQAKAKAGSVEVRQIIKFKLGNVFDIAQTNCPTEDYPKIFNMGYTSEQHAQIFNALVDVCNNQYKCNVDIQNFGSIALRGQAYTFKNTIELNEKLNDTEKVSTLSHEMGHFFMHHNNDFIGKSKSQIELEADIYSVMLQSHFGIELTQSRKMHLAEHYKAFMSSVNNLGEDVVKPTLEDALSNANEAYKASIEIIDNTVNKYVSEDLSNISDRDNDGIPDKIDDTYNPPEEKNQQPEENYAYAEVTQVQLEKLESSNIDYESRINDGRCIVRFDKGNEEKVEQIISASKSAAMTR